MVLNGRIMVWKGRIMVWIGRIMEPASELESLLCCVAMNLALRLPLRLPLRGTNNDNPGNRHPKGEGAAGPTRRGEQHG